MTMTMMSGAEWWQLLDQSWSELRALLQDLGLIADPAAVETMKRQRDVRIARLLTHARRLAPRPREARRIRSWRLLLDLCAEQWVLYRGLA